MAAVLSSSLLLAGAGPALAQYAWKDSRGVTYFSDLPPPREIPDKDVLQRPSTATRQVPTAAPPASAVAAARQAARTPMDPELDARRKLADNEVRARARADDEILTARRDENCRRARRQLEVFASGARLVTSNGRGERQVIDDATRAAEIDVARRVIATDCP